MIYLISPDKKQYKANLHSHSTLSDGNKTPKELKEMYKEQGYSILAITDHERPALHHDLSDDGFLMLTGYEAYIRPSEKGEYNVYNKEIHLNLFARDPMNQKIICFNENYSRYIRRGNILNKLERVGSERQRKYSREYINEFIRTANENGYLVAYNHPYWSMEDEADILSYDGLFSLEICNYNSYISNHLEYCGALYDKMLRSDHRIFCHGSDDNHNGYPLDHPHSDSFGAFTMICPEEFTYDAVIEAIPQCFLTAYPRHKAVQDKISPPMEDVLRKKEAYCAPLRNTTIKMLVFIDLEQAHRENAYDAADKQTGEE